MLLKNFCFYVLTLSSTALAQIGSKCEVQLTRQSGRCQTSCPTVEKQAKAGISPTLCGYYQIVVPIVCCPIEHSNKEITNHESSTRKTYSNHYRPGSSVHNQPDADPLIFPDDPIINNNENSNRISQQKCKEYSKLISEVVQALPLVTYAQPISISVEKCDYNSVPLIVGGEPAVAGEFPFMAALGYQTDDHKWRCGGTLISDRFVVTAAHCMSTRQGFPVVVRLGELDLAEDFDGSEYQDYDIEKVIIHPDYKYPLKYHDIALIKLSTTVEFTKFIRPACLYTIGSMLNQTAVATGWGKTDFAGENTNKLMKVSLKLYNNNRCAKTYQNNRELPNGIVQSMLCVGDLQGGKDTCQGDSGGPLLITKAGNHCKFYIIGITSFGKSCGQVNTPAIYTKISSYVDWIEQNVWPEE